MTGLVLHPRPDLAVFTARGADRARWLNGLVTCDLAIRKPGEGAYGLSVGKTGKILAELWVLFGDDALTVVLASDIAERVRDTFDRHLIMEDVELGEVEPRGVVFAHAGGPIEAKALVARARSLGAEAAIVDWTGRGDAVVIVANEPAAALAAKVAGAGARVIDDAAWEPLRVAWGLPRFGVDFDDQSLPQEASLEKVAVSFTKGCYLGQETVFMLEKRGHVKKRLMRLTVQGDEALDRSAPLTLPSGEEVGSITSAAIVDGSWAALGHVKYKHANPGVELVVSGRTVNVVGPAAEPIAPT